MYSGIRPRGGPRTFQGRAQIRVKRPARIRPETGPFVIVNSCESREVLSGRGALSKSRKVRIPTRSLRAAESLPPRVAFAHTVLIARPMSGAHVPAPMRPHEARAAAADLAARSAPTAVAHASPGRRAIASMVAVVRAQHELALGAPEALVAHARTTRALAVVIATLGARTLVARHAAVVSRPALCAQASAANATMATTRAVMSAAHFGHAAIHSHPSMRAVARAMQA
jgi:hypothetical protein